MKFFFENYKKAKCQVVGNGVTGIRGSVKDVAGRRYKSLLQKLDVKFNFNPHKPFKRPENFEMKANSKTGVCMGDTGGPMFCSM